MIFLKLNILSILYAINLFIQTELLVNVYRIQRITGLNNNTVNPVINTVVILVFIITSIVCYYMTKSLLGKNNFKFITGLLWIPYYHIFIKLFASFFPLTNLQESPLPGIGLVIIFFSLLYPFYITFVNIVSTIRTK